MTALPHELSLRETAHGTGVKGMAFYRYADREHGVHMEARRESSRHRFEETFWWDYLPGQIFPSYGALRAAVDSVTPEDIAAEKAMYPYVRKANFVGNRTYSNKCRLCKEDGFLIVHLATNWQPSEDRYAELCNGHRFLADHPQALAEALDAEVAARKARAATKGLP
jgi:hypothetical protein